MPIVRAVRQVSTAPIAGVRKGAHATALSEGAGLEEAKAQTGTVIARAGEQAAQIGISLYAKEQQKARQQADEVAFLEASNKLDAWELSRIHDPEKGALTTRGKAVIGMSDQVDTEYRALTGEIAQGLATPEQKAAFQKHVAQRGFTLQLKLDRLTVEQMDAFDKAETDAKIANAHSLAIIHAGEPEGRTTIAIAEGIAAIEKRGAREGRGPVDIAGDVAAFQSSATVGIITNLLSQNQTRQAKGYFEEAKAAGWLSGEALNKIQAAVQAQTTDAEGERTAATLWAAHGPKGDSDPISLDVMEQAAREQLGDDTDTLKATIQALRSRKQGVDDGRRERKDKQDDDIWGSIFRGESFEAVKQTPAFITAGGEEQNRVKEYFRREGEHRENLANAAEGRAASRESRAASRESREYTAKVREQNELEMDGYAKYYELSSDPAALRALSPPSIMAMAPTLGREHVGRLLADHAKLTKDDAGFSQATMDANLRKEVLHSAGFTFAYNTGAKLLKRHKATLGLLTVAIDQAIGQATLAKRQPLTPDEQRTVAQGVVDKKVLIPSSLTAAWIGFPRSWGPLGYVGVPLPYWHSEETTAVVVPAEDRASAYVPMDQIPDGAVQEYTNYLRGEAPVSPAVRSQRIERAYARRLMGATRAEVEAALKGGR